MVIIIKLNSIGYIKTNYKKNAPQHPKNSDKKHYLELERKYISELNYLEKFNYIYVLYYFDRVNNKELEESKENDIGIFATRSPIRPNPIGLSIVKVIRVKENKVFISGIDALNNSPILDIKPYIKVIDLKLDANSGWLRKDNMLDNKIYLYTDGACSGNPGPGGYAALIINGDKKLEITGYDPDTTNNRMELMAVLEGLKEIKVGSEVRIISDSNYVLQGLNKWVADWKKRDWKTASKKDVKNQDLWKKLDAIISKYNVEYIKVKGHSGHEYNDRVDTLARDEIEKNL